MTHHAATEEASLKELSALPGENSSRESMDAFASITVSMFVDRARQCLHLFRAQHAELLSDSRELLESIGRGSQAAPELASALTRLISKLSFHLTLKRGVLGKQMSGDPRGRAVFDQFDRDLALLRQRASEVAKSYAAPSQIADGIDEFRQDVQEIANLLEERFRAEERDLFTEFDRYALQ